MVIFYIAVLIYTLYIKFTQYINIMKKISQYWLHILLTILIKIILLTIIWYLFFRHDIILDDASTSQHVYSISSILIHHPNFYKV